MDLVDEAKEAEQRQREAEREAESTMRRLEHARLAAEHDQDTKLAQRLEREESKLLAEQRARRRRGFAAID